MKLGSTFPEVAIIQVENYDHGAAPMGVHVLEWVCVSHVQNADDESKICCLGGSRSRCTIFLVLTEAVLCGQSACLTVGLAS